MTTIDKFLTHAGKVVIIIAIMANAQAAITDIAQAPLVTSSASTQLVKPNVFLMMDDSGSMGWDYMPDDTNNFSGNYGFVSSQCNGVYYDPAITHTPPVKADGTSYPNSTFTSAWTDGYNTGLGTTNLDASFSSGGTTGSAFYYAYTGTQTTNALKNYANTNSTFYKECNSAFGAAPGNAVFKKYRLATAETTTITINGTSSTSVSGITVNGTQIMSAASGTATTSSSTLASNIAAKITLNGYSATASGSTVTITGPSSAANFTPVITQSGGMTLTLDVFPDTTASKLTNFANWYSYYRTRINMMKTATGWAFNNIGSNYRVGFATMNNNGGSDFLNLAPFVNTTSPASTQRTDFYAKLYGTSPGSSTPLLQALSSAGLLYAHKLPNNTLNTVTAKDPVEYSCQQNFTILSTDGFWNNATNTTLKAQPGSSCSPTTGPSTTAVGNCDGTEVRPMFDGATTSSATATPTTTVDTKQTVTNQNTTKVWQRTITTTAATKGTGGCSSNRYLVTSQPQTFNELINNTVTSVDNYTTVVTSTVTTINGLSGAPVITTVGPTASNVSSNTVINSDTGAPSGSTTWTNGTATTSCSTNPIPAAGTSTTSSATLASTTNATIGTPAVTLLSSVTTVGSPVTTVTSSGGTSNTLSDVAEYYYVTDIRDSSLANTSGVLGTDVSTNNVPTSGLDAASWQHMTTFTLGLGARGSMVFSPTYQTDSSGDFFSVKHGLLADSTTGVCSWQANGTVCNWPIPISNGPTTIDDLWHAAVDGRGTYFSATNPASLSTGISSALAGVSARTGSSASASISNPNISTGDNFIFSSNFVSQDWYGRLVRQQLDLTTGALSSTIDWEAGALLDSNTARNIYAFSGTAANGLQVFNATNFGGNANFNTPNINSLTQFCTSGASCLTAAQKTAAAGSNLVAYLAGDRSNEGYPADLTKYYRQRAHLLGDIVDSQAAYVKAPLLLYSDTGYADFVTAKAARQSMIYVGANDGMLHAFYATSDMMDNVTGDVVTSGGVNVTGGAEAWAFVPTAVMPNLYKLADINYAGNHQYFVDGSPLATDICPTAPAVQCSGTSSTTTTWKTILVGGLNAGGKSYYALDVTNPAAPKALWEFTNANLGYSYGNPQIVKLGGTGTGAYAGGTWVVLLTSGYNNADGLGHLFVLNAYTGALLLDISTGVGSPTSPSGLSRIIAQVVNPSLDSTVLQVYGGDLLGNLWRFDINGNVGAAGFDAQLLATLKGPNGAIQPITSKPEVGLINGKTVVFVGTGRYLGVTDLTDATQASPNLQTMYGIMDPLLANTTPSVAIYPNPRTVTTNPFVQQTEFTATCPQGAPATLCTFGQIIRTSTNNAVSIPANSGWYVDFPDSGERLNTDPMLQLGLLAFNTNVPSSSVCATGGNSYNYVLDYTTGSFPSNAIATISATTAASLPTGMSAQLPNGTYTMGIVAGQHTGSLSTAPIFISLPNGNKALCTNDSTGVLICRPVNTPPPTGGARRVSWRQLLSK
ncbi:MAG: hypothetical protein HY016_12045 [Nitrosomonadales bacterium]|nr:hypothetical protein [Nitrosomonadales bacterium]